MSDDLDDFDVMGVLEDIEDDGVLDDVIDATQEQVDVIEEIDKPAETVTKGVTVLADQRPVESFEEEEDYKNLDDTLLDDVVNEYAQESKPMILDMGTHSFKVGLAGDVKPIEERAVRVVSTEDQKENQKKITNLYGEDAIQQIINLYKADAKRRDSVNNVVHNDISYESEHFQEYLKAAIFHERHIYDRLGIEGTFDSSAHRILLTDQIQSPRSHRSVVSELLFETFNTPAVYWELSGVLALYAMGKQDGLVVDMGHSHTSITPVVQGYCMEHALRKVNIGGKHFDQYFNHLLRKAGITLHTNYWLETVRNIKETMCRLVPDKAFEKLGDDGEMNCESYTMPDGSVMKIGNALKRGPEIFFAPHLLGLQCRGIQHQILDCINDCDLGVRKTLMSNIRLTGGSSMMNGLGRRLVNELALSDYNRYEYEKLIRKESSEVDELDVRPSIYSPSTRKLAVASKKPQKVDKKTQVRLYAPKSRKHSAWIGGSVLCQMDDFDETWITKRHYNEYGKNILYRGVSWQESV